MPLHSASKADLISSRFLETLFHDDSFVQKIKDIRPLIQAVQYIVKILLSVRLCPRSEQIYVPDGSVLFEISTIFGEPA